MKISRGLLALVRAADRGSSERRVVAAATAALIRQRRPAFQWVAPFLALLPQTTSPKLTLWSQLAQATLNTRRLPRPSSLIGRSLIATEAYSNARSRLLIGSSGLWLRGPGYRKLLARLCDLAPERLMLFHHYDCRGVLPKSWLELLKVVQCAGWQVIVSTSCLQASAMEELEAVGVQIALRSNIGLCLGAYRDLSLALLSDPKLCRHVHSLVLCNDSTLPLHSPEHILRHLNAWCRSSESAVHPILSGLTDSAERGQYHLQSYCLLVNRALLEHHAWLKFWLMFSLIGSKDDLINHGEIGLSQVLLAAGIQLRAAYPLVDGLLHEPAMAQEIDRYGLHAPSRVNQSLFAWQALLARGFPLVKKRILLDSVDPAAQLITLSELMQWVPRDRQALIANDLHQLFISRYTNVIPDNLS